MRLQSPHWDEENGVCTKHWIPETPCPSCMCDPKANEVTQYMDKIELSGWLERDEFLEYDNVPLSYGVGCFDPIKETSKEESDEQEAT